MALLISTHSHVYLPLKYDPIADLFEVVSMKWQIVLSVDISDFIDLNVRLCQFRLNFISKLFAA
jgi:hypothetical protein